MYLTYRFGPKDGALDELFKLQEEVYNAGARNFVFIDLPPIQRSPAGVPFEFDTFNSIHQNYQFRKAPIVHSVQKKYLLIGTSICAKPPRHSAQHMQIALCSFFLPPSFSMLF